MNSWLAVVALTLALAVAACSSKQPEKPLGPTAQQTLDRCNLDGAAANPNPYGTLATPSYLVVCMRANGWFMRTDADCEGTTEIQNGIIVDPPHWDDPTCYDRAAVPNSN